MFIKSDLSDLSYPKVNIEHAWIIEIRRINIVGKSLTNG